jgi:hypothetical protein
MLSLLLPLTSTRAIAADPVGDFSDFLIDRANDNFIYLFQVNLKKNPFFVTYFPETLRIAQSSDLRSLMPNRDLWRESIKRDMETALASKLRDRLVPLRKVLCGYIRYSEDGQKFLKLQNVWGYGSSPVAEKWKTAVNDLQYFCGLGNDPDEWIRWVKGLTSSKKTAQGVTIEPNYTAQDLKPALERPNPSYLLGFRSTPDERVQFILASLSNVISTYDTAQTKCVGVGGKGEPRKSYTQCAIALADFVEAGAHAVSDLDGDKCDKDTKYDCGDNSQILRFRRYAVFFAQLGDLKSEGALSGALLKSVTVPPISFGAKREPDIGLWSVTAYFAASAGHTEGVPLPSNNLLNKCCSLFVPLGFEWSWGTRSRASNSLFVSALDFGNPVTQKLNGTYTGAKLTDVTAPGLFYVHGLQDSPIAWGIGAERVATGLSPNTRETRFLLFIGLDLPLLIMP